jgi:biopolymer transport protein ExbD
MFQSTQTSRSRDTSGTLVDIAPLIDVVFILLIFFLVTATFVQPTGVTVNKPQASHVKSLAPQSLRVAITPSGALYSDGQPTDLSALRRQVREFQNKHENGAVIVVPDQNAAAGRLVEVMDTARAAGARDVSVATKRRD